MKKIKLLLLFFAISISVFSQNTYLSFTNGVEGKVEGIETLPERSFQNLKSNNVEIGYNFTGAYVAETKVETEIYNFLHINGFSPMGQVGAPALPAKNEVIAMPRGATGKLEILSADYVEYDGYMIHPTLEPARDTEGAPAPEFEKDSKVYSANKFFPKNIVEITNVGLMRGTLLAYVEVRPVQFNPVTKKIRVYTNIKYKLISQGGESDFNYIANENTLHFTNMLKRKVINSESIPNGISSENQKKNNKTGAKNYIIITHSQYLSQANQLANWKRQMGYSVEVVSQASWTYVQVETEVNNRYTSWIPKPDYVVIMGDHTGSYAVPGKVISTPYSAPDDGPFATDLYITCMDGASDWHPDMARGRISVSSSTEATTIVNKIINYEQNPVNQVSYYENGVNCAQFQDKINSSDTPDGIAARRFCHTSENIRDYLKDEQNYTMQRIYYTDNANTPEYFNNTYFSNYEAIPTELLRSNGYQWDGDANDITASINAGKFMVFHRDHGYSGGSGWAHPYYTTSTMNSLSNGDLQPVIFSMNCHTGEYQLDNCFAEKFMRMENKGAVGVFAASYFSLSGYNDALSIGMIDAIWSDPGVYPVMGTAGTGTNYTIGAGNDIYTMGDVLLQGLYAMEQNVSWSSKRQYEYELFHYFGDPAMKIWTSNPNNNIITATHDATIDCTNSTFSITGSTPDALATLVYNNELLGQVTIDASGNGSISYALSVAGNVTLTISKHNNKPYVAIITQNCSGYPPTIVTNPAINITQTSASINADITNNNGATVTESGFVYSTTSDPIIGGAGVTQIQTSPVVVMGTFSEGITGLNANTVYYFKAYAINTYGTNYGNEQYLTTTCGVITSLPFTEDFSDGVLPNCWGNNDNEGSAQIWQFNNPGDRIVNTTTSTNGFVIFDSDNYGSSGNQNADLISPTLNLSNYTSVNLFFEHYFREYTGSSAELSYSTNGGNTWVSIESWTASTSNAIDFDQDLTAELAGQSNVKIKWNYTGSWAFYWAIDDINITGTLGTITPIATVSTTPGCNNAGTVTVSSNQSGTQTFELYNSDGSSLLASNTIDATFYDFAGQTNGTYTGKVIKGTETSILSSQTTLTNLVEPVAPTSVSATATDICSGTPVTLSYTNGSGATFAWYPGSCGGTSVGVGNNLSVSPTTTTNYYGRWENACGESTCESIEITVSDMITANAGSDIQTCVATTPISALDPTPGIGTWSVISGGATIADVNANNTTITIISSPVTLRWEVVNGACLSSDDLIVTLNEVIVITSQPQDVNATVGDDVSFSISADNAIGYQWRFAGSDITNADQTTYSITNVQTSNSGNYDVLVSGECGDLISDVAILDVTVSIDNLSDYGISIYPNPSNGIFNIEFAKSINKGNFSISDMTGKVIYTNDLTYSLKHEIDLSSYSKGVYFIQFNIDGEILVSKLIME